jgi:hypothetical protein
MTDATKTTEPTVSDDPNLYTYTPDTAPDDVVINIGNSPQIVTAPHATSDPHRIEVGDRRRGDYYISLVGTLPGLMPLKRVDARRLDQVNKIRNIRIGDREPDWVVAARKKSEEVGAEQPPAYVNPHSDLTPLQRASKGI